MCCFLSQGSSFYRFGLFDCGDTFWVQVIGFADFESVFILVRVNGEWDVEGDDVEGARLELGVCTY